MHYYCLESCRNYLHIEYLVEISTLALSLSLSRASPSLALSLSHASPLDDFAVNNDDARRSVLLRLSCSVLFVCLPADQHRVGASTFRCLSTPLHSPPLPSVSWRCSVPSSSGAPQSRGSRLLVAVRISGSISPSVIVCI